MLYNESMAVPILATKLYIPPPPPKVVNRTRLIERLDEGLIAGHKLALISAPAGFGKTTLVSEWIHKKDEMNAAWLSLDEEDSDLARFLTYLLAALRTVAPDLGGDALHVLQAAPSPPTEAILTALLNEIMTIRDPFLIVLDDYHVIDSTAVDEALTFLVEHLSPQMLLVITTRDDRHTRARDQPSPNSGAASLMPASPPRLAGRASSTPADGRL